MKNFAALFTALDSSTKTTVKLAALTQYFTTAPGPDRVWTIAILSGRRPKRAVALLACRTGMPLIDSAICALMSLRSSRVRATADALQRW